MRELIGRYKFNGARAAGRTLGGLLHESLPDLPADTLVTSVPTAPPHIRERGYDHAALIAKEFARARQLPYSPALKRRHTLRQRGASRKERLSQAATAFVAIKPVRGGRYLLIDDVCTTGATLLYAARALCKAGADEVWVAVITKEPLD
jgi:ComF family protein